jgi:hypothetical protein
MLLSKFNRLTILMSVLIFATALLSTGKANSNESMPDRSELEAALQECAASSGAVGDGLPDESAMDECMSAKGFTKPSGQRGPDHNDMRDGSPMSMRE